MTYIEESLSAGEQVEGLFRLHWVAWLPMAIWGIDDPLAVKRKIESIGNPID